MTNLEKYNKAFEDSFELSLDQLNNDLVYQSVAAWDSVGHMSLIAVLEESFDIMLDTDDIIGFSSYSIGKEILSRYSIDL
jgi:acyl carrier protein